MSRDWERPGERSAGGPQGRPDRPWEHLHQHWHRPEEWDQRQEARTGGTRATGGLYFRMGHNPAGPKMGAALVLIVIGTAFFLNNLGILHVGSLWQYWPLLLILAGVGQISSARSEGAYVRAFIEVGVGVVFQLQNLGMLHVRLFTLWPLALIGVGILLLFRPGFARLIPARTGDIRNEVNEFAFFGGVKRVLTTRDFRGGELLSVFGGIELDLRGADIAAGVQQIHIEANAAFGGIDIKVPDRWHVEVHGMGIFGGYEDKTLAVQQGIQPGAPVLIIHGFAAFGGVNVE